MSVRDDADGALVPQDTARLRIAAYNIHSGLGLGQPMWRAEGAVRRDLRDVARRLADAAPADAPLDVVILNEVDFDARRSHHLDEARLVALELSRLTHATYAVVYGQTFERTFPGFEARFGNALLVRGATTTSERFRLPAPTGPFPGRAYGILAGFFGEPRGALRVTLEIGGRAVDVVGTHLDANRVSAREAQAIDVLRRAVRRDRATIVAGDMNSSPDVGGRAYRPGDRTYAVLTSGPLLDARALLGPDPGSFATVPSTRPRWPIDAVFASPALLPLDVKVLPGTASDHRGVAATFTFSTPAQARLLTEWHAAERRERVRRLIACEPGGKPSAELARWLLNATELVTALPAEARAALQERSAGGVATTVVLTEPETTPGDPREPGAPRPAG